jgi:hypothetical protein
MCATLALLTNRETLFYRIYTPVHCDRQAVLDASKKIRVYLMKTYT